MYRFLLCACAVSIISCSGYERESFRMETGKPYSLKEFPDSVFIDTLDRFFEKEWVRPERVKAEITINPNMKYSLPQEKKTIKEKNKVRGNNSAPQNFAEVFVESLTKLSENPNSALGFKTKAKEGETLENLLVRVYGQRAKQVPKFLTESQIKALNPSINFEYLFEGQKVLLPKL